MPKRVRSRRLAQARIPHGLLHRSLKRLIAEVMAAHDAAARVARARGGGKNILPRPLAVRRGILAHKGVRQAHAAASLREVGLVHGARASQLVPQRCYQASGKYGHPILAAFAVADDDGAALELDILDSQTHRLEDAHARTVKKAAHQTVRSMQAAQHGGHFRARQDEGQSQASSRARRHPGTGARRRARPCTEKGVHSALDSAPTPRRSERRQGWLEKARPRLLPWTSDAACRENG